MLSLVVQTSVATSFLLPSSQSWERPSFWFFRHCVVCVCCTTNSDSFAVCSETVQHRLNFYSKTASSLNLWCTGGGGGVFLSPPFLLFLIYFVVPGEEKEEKKIGTKTLYSLHRFKVSSSSSSSSSSQQNFLFLMNFLPLLLISVAASVNFL